MSTGDVTTSYSGRSWTYDVEGEKPLGHTFDTKDAAVAGGRFLAKQNAATHIILNADGTVDEVHTYRDLDR